MGQISHWDTDCHTSDIGHWFAMTAEPLPIRFYRGIAAQKDRPENRAGLYAYVSYSPACASRPGILDSQPRDMICTPWQ